MKKLKKTIALFLSAVVALSMLPVTALANSDITIKVDGVVLQDAKAVLKDGATLLPVRSVGNALGVHNNNVIWTADTQTVTLLKGESIVTITIGEKTVNVNGTAISISTPAQIIDGRTYVPLRALGDALGCGIAWVNETKTVEISKDKSAVTEPAPTPAPVPAPAPTPAPAPKISSENRLEILKTMRDIATKDKESMEKLLTAMQCYRLSVMSRGSNKYFYQEQADNVLDIIRDNISENRAEVKELLELCTNSAYDDIKTNLNKIDKNYSKITSMYSYSSDTTEICTDVFTKNLDLFTKITNGL